MLPEGAQDAHAALEGVEGAQAQEYHHEHEDDQ